MKILVYLALFLLGLVPAMQASDRPNIILIMVDDLGYSDFGCYGSEIQTPNIDALAESGLRFSRFYNTASVTPPGCRYLRACTVIRRVVPN